MTEFAELRPGDHIGRHVVVEAPQGRTAVVYDPDLERDVLLELLDGADPDAVQRLAGLAHPNVVAVYDTGLWREQTYVTFERVRGGKLTKWLAARPSALAIMRMFVAAGEGLAAAHSADVVHGRLDAERIVIDRDDRPRLTGFVFRAGAPTDEAHREDQRALCQTMLEAVAGGDAGSLRVRLRWAGGATSARAITRGLDSEPSNRWASVSELVDVLRSGLQSRRWVWAVALAAGVGIIGIGAVTARGKPACGDELAELERVWNPTRASALTRAFAATPIGHATETAEHVTTAFDAYADEWSKVARGVCNAMLERPGDEPELRARQSACLARRLAEADALLAVLEVADESVVKRATDATAQLAAAADCLDPAASRQPAPPSDPSTAQEVEKIDAELRRARALSYAGKFDKATAATEAALQRAEETKHLPTLARAVYGAGTVHHGAGRYSDAREALARATWLGLEVGDARLSADAAMANMRCIAISDADEASALFWSDLITAVADREGFGQDVEAGRLGALGAMYSQRRDYAAARELYEKRTVIVDARRGADSLDAAAAGHDLALALYLLGDYVAARPILERVLPRFEAHHGRRHRIVATCLNTLGMIDLQEGHLDRARERMLESFEIRTEVLGAGHPETEPSLTGLGNVAMAREAFEEAEQWFARSYALTVKTVGEDHKHAALAIANQGRAARQQGQLPRAIELLQQSVAAYERGARWDPRRSAVLSELARAYKDADRLDDAMRTAEAVVRTAKELAPNDPLASARGLATRSEINFALGRREASIADLEQGIAILEAAGERGAAAAEDLRSMLAERR